MDGEFDSLFTLHDTLHGPYYRTRIISHLLLLQPILFNDNWNSSRGCPTSDRKIYGGNHGIRKKEQKEVKSSGLVGCDTWTISSVRLVCLSSLDTRDKSFPPSRVTHMFIHTMSTLPPVVYVCSALRRNTTRVTPAPKRQEWYQFPFHLISPLSPS